MTPARNRSSRRRTDRAAPPQIPARLRPLLILILSSYFVIVLNNALMLIGLPEIRAEFGMTSTQLSWVQNCFTLAFGGVLLLGARLSDVWGRRSVFLIGLIVFSCASLVAASAVSVPMLLAARAAQGLGAGILAPATLALLTATFPAGPQRTRAVAAYGSVAGVGASVGLIVGGALTALASWRLGFAVNVPIGLVLAIVALKYVSRSARIPQRFDVAGAILSVVGPACLLYGVLRSAEAGWTDPVTIASLGAGTVAIVAFVFVERRARHPIMPLRLFADPRRAGAYVARMLYMGAIMGFTFFCSQFLQVVLGFDPLTAGFAFLPFTLVNVAAAMVVAPLTRRFGNTWLLSTGLAVTAGGMLLLAHVSPSSEYLADMVTPFILIGIGQGLALAPLTVAGIVGVLPEDTGAGSGVVNVAHQLGASLGLAVLVAVATGVAGTAPTAETLAHQSSAAFAGAAVMLALALVVVALTLLRRPDNRRDRAARPGRRTRSGTRRPLHTPNPKDRTPA